MSPHPASHKSIACSCHYYWQECRRMPSPGKREQDFEVDDQSSQWACLPCVQTLNNPAKAEQKCTLDKSKQSWGVPLKSFPLNHSTADAALYGSSYVTVPSPCMQAHLYFRAHQCLQWMLARLPVQISTRNFCWYQGPLLRGGNQHKGKTFSSPVALSLYSQIFFFPSLFLSTLSMPMDPKCASMSSSVTVLGRPDT